MEFCHDQLLDSPSKNSYIGSYHQPPDKILPIPAEAQPSSKGVGLPTDSPAHPQTKRNIDRKAVENALRTLQEKIRRLEKERAQSEKSQPPLLQDAEEHQPVTTTSCDSQTSTSQDAANRRELDSKLQSAESRCKMLEKQLDHIMRMVETARKEKGTPIMENERQEWPSSLDDQIQREKLEKLESECLKLSRTQNMSEMKLAVLEQRLLKEEHERKLVQEKAGQLQRELDLSLRLSSQASQQAKPQTTTKKVTVKTPRHNEMTSPRHKRIPFVAGTSTSPSHSVHANVQSILHMMKHHQPQLCQRVSALHRSGCGARKSLQMDVRTTPARCDGELEHQDQSLGSLSDLLLALQDELGQMGFEHQELVHQIDATRQCEQRRDLQRELEALVDRMDKKGAQISKLRKHQQTVHILTQQPSANKMAAKPKGIRLSASSPIPNKQQDKQCVGAQKNLQILRESQKLRNSLKQDDISWEV
ncbi:centrosomal protein CEP57L1 [Dunckerocampus dactyliophorus]|uniref:centrosomal protein CEP57L1 n=1 Tax=Dunckerocampus dactyliophorus TaxID=161453 RepID=UPI0024067E79|nr:centrosomal protein CEP57L1 [Dunckerocampus dactyliophorus]